MEHYSPVELPNFLTDYPNALAFSADGHLLAIGGVDGVIVIHDVLRHHQIYQFVVRSSITALLWHSTARYTIFVGGADGSCSMYSFKIRALVCIIAIIQVSTFVHQKLTGFRARFDHRAWRIGTRRSNSHGL